MDLLAQMWRKDGVEAWVLVHISIASFAVLADPDPHGHPNAYVTEFWGCTSSQRLQGKIELVKELY